MTNLIVELSKFAFAIFIAMYTVLCFSVLKKKNQDEINYGWKLQNLLTFFLHLLAYVVIYLQTEEIRILGIYACSLSENHSSGTEQYVLFACDWLYRADQTFL